MSLPGDPAPGAPALEVRGIDKRFGAVRALCGVDLVLERGQVHAVLGENGAGKSTLMNVLFGLTQPDRGQLLRSGRPVHFRSPRDAMAAGIGMVHQHFTLVPTFTVAENLSLGRTPGRYRPKAAEARAREVADRAGLAIDPGAVVGRLSVGEQQRVEILKALSRDAEVLILDEPTGVLAPQEIDDLLALVRRLAGQGAAIVFISHKLAEVQRAADRVTVLRHGERVLTGSAASYSVADLARAMVGTAPSGPAAIRLERGVGEPALVTAGDETDPTAFLLGTGLPQLPAGRQAEVPASSDASHRPSGEVPAPARPDAGPGDTAALSIEELSVRDDEGRLRVRYVSLEVHAGKILGIAGVEGNGQAELAEAVTGLRPAASGRVRVTGASGAVREVARDDPAAYIDSGGAHIPEDRRRTGLILSMPIWENLILEAHRRRPFRRRIWLDREVCRRFAADTAAEYEIRAPSIDLKAAALSGGNQQKVVIGRELSREPRVLVAVHPTRGLDIRATAYVHGKIVEHRARGGATLLISSELDEILALSDRIAVMHNGRIVTVLPSTASREEIGIWMTRGAPDEFQATE